jgi:single-strand DNA-binding protein
MPYLNRYAFIGNLTRPPELRFQATGEKQALCLLNVAINRDSRDEAGERKSRTVFINDIEVWGPTGEACAHFLTQGSMVLVEGRMDVDLWQDRQSGMRRSRMKVVAETVQFLRIKRAGAEPQEEAVAAVAEAPDEPAPGPRRRARAARDRPPEPPPA